MLAAAKAEKSPLPQELRATEGLGLEMSSETSRCSPSAKEGSPGAGATGTCPEGQETLLSEFLFQHRE